jgi:predicted amidophosphoribosyltransferase
MESWLLGVLGVVAIVHTIAIVATCRQARAAGKATRQQADEIVCTECGTDNEPAYRFCRECVAELPGHGGPMGSAPRAAGGRHSN